MKPFMLRKKKKLVAVARRKILSARMGDTRDYRMTTIDSALRRSLDDRSGELILTLDPHFQGLPDTAHGGSVLAAFDALAGLTGPRHVGGVYRKRVPVGVPLALTHGRTEATHTFVVRDATSVLVNGRVAPVADTRRGAPAPLGDPWLLGVAEHGTGETFAFGWVAGVADEGRGRPRAHQLPISRTCFACGVDNTLGLRVRLEFDDAEVRGAWTPREPFRTADGTLATVALTTLCDEAAFWLGALATGESGMTTELAVTLRRAVPFLGALTVTGPRAAARPQPDPRYWDTEALVGTGARTPVPAARITFVGCRTDALGPRWTLALGGATMGLGAAVFGGASTFGVAFAGRLLVGLGASVMLIAWLSLAAAWFRPDEFATISGWTQTVGNAGALLASSPLALLVEAVGWRHTFVVIGGVTLVLAAGAAGLIRDRPEGMGFPPVNPEHARRSVPTLREVLRGVPEVMRNPRTWPPILATGFAASGLVLVWSCVREVKDPARVGIAIGFCNVPIFLGVAVLQWLTGVILDARWAGLTAGGARHYPPAAYQAAFTVCLALAAGALMAALCVTETRCRNVWTRRA